MRKCWGTERNGRKWTGRMKMGGENGKGKENQMKRVERRMGILAHVKPYYFLLLHAYNEYIIYNRDMRAFHGALYHHRVCVGGRRAQIAESQSFAFLEKESSHFLRSC
jgi:hypothetical protein